MTDDFAGPAKLRRAKLSFVKGEGAWLIEADGRRFLDLGAGIAVNALGHAHPALVAGADRAGRKALAHLEPLQIPQAGGAGRRLVEHTFADTVFFTNSGTEAANWRSRWRASTATKGQPERTTILTFEGASTAAPSGAIAAAGSEKLTKGFGPLLPGFRHLPFGDHDALRAAHDRPDVGAILIEPVQGEGGIRPLPDLPQGPARSLRRTRAPADPRRGAMRHGPDRQALRP
jgi:acetylornithine/N-succinyldiaminopimelate aminotransferase